ncbi:MAG: carboxypeptidase-like regulatory domain-containing protein [Nitrososphaerales archaeon]
MSSTGVGTWTNTASYVSNIYGQSCAINSGYIYCVGGYTGAGYTSAVYYSEIVTPVTTTVTSTSTVTTTATSTQTVTSTATSTQTVTSTATSTQTVTSTATSTQTVTSDSTSTSTVTTTLPASTVTSTETLPASTTTSTETLPASTTTSTETLPASTVTSTETLPASTTTVTPTQSNGGILARVYSSGGAPISNIAVTISNSSGFTSTLSTNASGEVLFANLSSGTYNVAAIVDGAHLSAPVSVSEGSDSVIVLEPSTSSTSSTQSSSSSTLPSSTSSSSSSSGGIPEFPFEPVLAAIFTILILGSYVVIRRRIL